MFSFHYPEKVDCSKDRSEYRQNLTVCPHERLHISAQILMYLLFSVLMEGRPVSHSGVVSDLSDSHVEILRTLIMLDMPVWEYQLYLCAAECRP